YLGQRPLSQVLVLQVDEPLLRGTENHRMMAAPAVRIGMLHRLGMKQCSSLPQNLEHNWIRVEDSLARKPVIPLDEPASSIHRTQRLQFVLFPHFEIFLAVTGSGVDDPRPLLHSDMLSQNAYH